jgi:hypothetical protein
MKHASLFALALIAVACGNGTTTPSTTSVVVSATPTSGTVVVPAAYPYIDLGGVLLPKGSGLISARVTLTSARETPLARLSVYLLTGNQPNQFCGQNSNDWPTWTPLPDDFTTTYEVTGFRVYQLPCDVTGIRAILHTHGDPSGLGLGPPGADEILAETTVPVSFRILQ